MKKIEKPRVYVAGPISIGPLEQNIRNACEAGMRLLRAGFAPLVPHLTCYMGGESKPEVLPQGTVHTDWYESDLPWVEISHAVLRLPGESKGADLETGLANKLGIPVYTNIEELIADLEALNSANVLYGDPRFHAATREMSKLHSRKSRDYGSAKDPLTNIRASEEFGVPAWLGATIRLNDKITRLKSLARNGKLANESGEDSFIDIAVYAIIGLILLREANGTQSQGRSD